MTRQEIEAVLERVKDWPEDRQEEIASIILEMDGGLYALSEDERTDIRRGVAEADRGDFAPAARIKAILAPGE